MSTKEEILSYVQHTPSNTNLNVLGGMLNNLSGGGSLPQVTEQDNGSVLIVKDGVWKKQSGYGYCDDDRIINYSSDMEEKSVPIQEGGTIYFLRITDFFIPPQDPNNLEMVMDDDGDEETIKCISIEYAESIDTYGCEFDIGEVHCFMILNNEPYTQEDITLQPGCWLQTSYHDIISDFSRLVVRSINLETIQPKFINGLNNYYQLDDEKTQSQQAREILQALTTEVNKNNYNFNLFLINQENQIPVYHLTFCHRGLGDEKDIITEAQFTSSWVYTDDDTDEGTVIISDIKIRNYHGKYSFTRTAHEIQSTWS